MRPPTASPHHSTPPPSAPRVTAPPGRGLVVIPGAGPGGAGTSVGHPAKQPVLPGSQTDATDFYGLAGALAVVVGAILVVRRIVPLRHQPALGRHPGPPPAGSRPAEGEP